MPLVITGTVARTVPLPGSADSDVVVPPPGGAPGYWAGAPSVVGTEDGAYLAYRLRRPVGEGRGFAVVVAHSPDGRQFEPVCQLHKDDFATDSFERPALVRLPDGRWRLFVSSATPGTLHWRVEAIDADRPEEFDPATKRPVTFGDPVDAYKDPVVEYGPDGWRMWVCRHRVDPPQDADAMVTLAASSADGLSWQVDGVAIAGRPGCWDSRGARLTSVLPGGRFAYYDGRATAAENWEERTGIARRTGPRTWTSISDEPVRFGPAGLRYLSLLEVPGGLRMFYEYTQADGAHALRSEYAPLPEDDSQSS